MHLRSSILFAVIAACCPLAIAGQSDTWRGQSEKYAVEFPDPLEEPNSTIEIAEYDANELGFVKQLAPVAFKTECRATRNDIVCAANGKSPLAGATYKRTHDATPGCPGNAEDRFTCMQGCKAAVPRYISITPYEC